MECYLSYNFYCSRFAQARNYDLGFEPQKQNENRATAIAVAALLFCAAA